MSGASRRPSFELPEDAPVYVISVAAELTGLHPQTLRQYDRLGLVSWWKQHGAPDGCELRGGRLVCS